MVLVVRKRRYHRSPVVGGATKPGEQRLSLLHHRLRYFIYDLIKSQAIMSSGRSSGRSACRSAFVFVHPNDNSANFRSLFLKDPATHTPTPDEDGRVRRWGVYPGTDCLGFGTPVGQGGRQEGWGAGE